MSLLSICKAMGKKSNAFTCGAYQSSIVNNEEKIIRSQLVNPGFSKDEAINLLIHHLANKNIFIKFLHIDRVIFSEQIRLLNYLNSKELLPTNELFGYYEEWKNRVKNQQYSFEQFLGFLSEQGLIINNVEGCTISVIGREYLSFIIKSGRSFF